jgi:tryptophan 2,3-dioxygenase
VSDDYTTAVLPGDGATDYARYMRTDMLLSLQRPPEDMVHRDELLFQTVHQSTELWLKHACFEVEQATQEIAFGAIETATRLLTRASLGLQLVTEQLEMLRHLGPSDFQLIRTVLGHGSGFESPGWRNAVRVSQGLNRTFMQRSADLGVNLVDVYHGSPDDPEYRLAEALIEWDERFALWRVRHYKIATRVIGHDVVGTKGTPVDVLARLIVQKFFPELWQVRTVLTVSGPMADAGSGLGS